MESFRTKRGRCIFDTETGELRLTPSWKGQFKRYYEGSKLIFALMVLFMLWGSFQVITADLRELVIGLLLLIAILAVGYLSNYVRGFTSRESIPLDAITAVTPIEGRWWTRPRFIVEYEVNGTAKKRYVMLPSPHLSYTDNEFERAKDLFRTHGIPIQTE